MGTAWHAKVAGIPKITLSFHTGPGEFTDVLVRLSENHSLAVRALLRPEAGADTSELVLDAQCSKPTTLPANVKPGMTTDVTINGIEGTARLLPTVDARHDAVVRATGQRIRLAWSSDAI